MSSEKIIFNGTGMYASKIFFDALEKGHFTSYLKPKTFLPMVYIDDCVKCTVDLLNADNDKLQSRVYNLGGISFSPDQLAEAIKKHIPGFTIDYVPDYRQAIADSWPRSIDESLCTRDWGWKYDITVDELAEKMFSDIERRYSDLRRKKVSNL